MNIVCFFIVKEKKNKLKKKNKNYIIFTGFDICNSDIVLRIFVNFTILPLPLELFLLHLYLRHSTIYPVNHPTSII